MSHLALKATGLNAAGASITGTVEDVESTAIGTGSAAALYVRVKPDPERDRHRQRPGSDGLTLVARDAAGNASRPKALSFRIVGK